MQQHDRLSLEQALAHIETDVENALRAANSTTRALKQLRTAVHEGNLRDLETRFSAAEQALASLQQQVATTREGWDFDQEQYFSDGAFKQELLETARQMNVQIFEQDDRLYCYPLLVRLLSGERSVLIDRTRERRVRPSVLIARLKDLQTRRPRFTAQDFLESLYQAYEALAGRQREQLPLSGRVERLIDIYNLFVLLPGQRREYSQQEFARDIYLLDQSGVTATRSGQRLTFSAAAGTRARTGLLRVVTQSGAEKLYWGIAFSQAE